MDWESKSSAAGAWTRDLTRRDFTDSKEVDASDSRGYADWVVVTAWLKPWLQQLLLRMARSSGSEPWHWWADFLRQQACGGVAVTASDSGASVPTSANKSKSLAVRRSMFCYAETEPQDGASIEQSPSRRKQRLASKGHPSTSFRAGFLAQKDAREMGRPGLSVGSTEM